MRTLASRLGNEQIKDFDHQYLFRISSRSLQPRGKFRYFTWRFGRKQQLERRLFEQLERRLIVQLEGRLFEQLERRFVE